MLLDTMGVMEPKPVKRRFSMSDMKTPDVGVETLDATKARLRAGVS
jgi:hypothetical protein